MDTIAAVGIVAKSRLSAATPHLLEVEAWLAARNIAAVVETATAALMPPSPTRVVADKQALVSRAGLVLVLGAMARSSAWRAASRRPAGACRFSA
jgi:hypothetical protein